MKGSAHNYAAVSILEVCVHCLLTVVFFTVALIEEHAMGFHHLVAHLAPRHMILSVLDVLQFRAPVEDGRVVGLLVRAVHVQDVAMDLIYMGRKCTVVVLGDPFEVLILGFENSGLLDELTAEVVDVLGDVHALKPVLKAKLLEGVYGDMTRVRLFLFA